MLFQTIQFSTQFSSIWPIDRTLSGATTLGQSGPGSDYNEGVLHSPQNSSITGTSPSDCFVISKTLVGRVRAYSSAEMQLVYSTALADKALRYVRWSIHFRNLPLKVEMASHKLCFMCIHIKGQWPLVFAFLMWKQFLLLDLLMFVSLYSKWIINISGTNLSPCKIPVTMLKLLVAPLSEWTIAFGFQN